MVIQLYLEQQKQILYGYLLLVNKQWGSSSSFSNNICRVILNISYTKNMFVFSVTDAATSVQSINAHSAKNPNDISNKMAMDILQEKQASEDGVYWISFGV